MRAPCYHCDERYLNCHSDCIDYKTWRIEQDKINEKKRKEVEENMAFFDLTNPVLEPLTEQCQIKRNFEKETILNIDRVKNNFLYRR